MSLAYDLGLVNMLRSVGEETKRKAMVEIVNNYKTSDRSTCPMLDDALAGKTTLTEEWKKLGKKIFREPGVFPRLLSGWDTHDEVKLVDQAIAIYNRQKGEMHGA